MSAACEKILLTITTKMTKKETNEHGGGGGSDGVGVCFSNFNFTNFSWLKLSGNKILNSVKSEGIQV